MKTNKREGSFCPSNCGRSTKTDETIERQAGCLTIKSVNSLTFRLETKQFACGCSGIGKREDLAQHTLAQPVRKLRQMSVTLVVNTLVTRRLAIFRSLMDVERRYEKRWQIYCQQHPRSDMSCYLQHLIQRASVFGFLWHRAISF